MISLIRVSRVVLASLALMMAAQDSTAQRRSIRVDVGADFFDARGEAWSGDVFPDLAGDGTVYGDLPFALNFGSGANLYDFSLSENGFVSIIENGGVLPTGNYIAPFAAFLVAPFDPPFSGVSFGTGLLDTSAGPPYDLSRAASAIRFTWRDMCPEGDPSCILPVSFQTILIDRGSGDFDLELNGFQPGPSQSSGFVLGTNQFLSLGPGSSDTYCFRDGTASACGVAIAVPEPGSVTLLALGLLALVGYSNRHRLPRRMLSTRESSDSICPPMTCGLPN